MSVTRRSFLTTVGAGSAGILASPVIGWRGHEALYAFQGTQQQQSVSDRKADRLLSSRPGMVRLDSNENPNGPGQHVYDAIVKHLTESNRYPVKGEVDLTETIAKNQHVNASNVLLGCGSGELLRSAVQAYTSQTAGLVSPAPTFESPATFAKTLDRPIASPKVDSKLMLDLDAMVDAAKGAGLVYLCNPNNPTATVHGKSDIASYIDRVNKVSPNTIILVDEAYHEYVENPDYATAIPIAMENPKVIVTRTFSKVFGMAGLRAGYAIGNPDTLSKMVPWMLGSGLNQLVLVSAMATLNNTAHIAAEQKKNREARTFTRSFFEKAGYTVAKTDANFLMVDIHRDPKQFKADCIKQSVAVGRAFPGLPTYARISIGTMAEMQKAIPVFNKILSASVSSAGGGKH